MQKTLFGSEEPEKKPEPMPQPQAKNAEGAVQKTEIKNETAPSFAQGEKENQLTNSIIPEKNQTRDEKTHAPAPVSGNAGHGQNHIHSNADRKPDYDGFFAHARKIGDLALSFSNPIVIHHLDCDGLTSGALAKQAFLLKGRTVPTVMLKKLDDDSVKQIPTDKDLVVTDLGAGQVELLEALANKNIVILDHHPPSKETHIPMLNCHQWGFDGAVDACSASTCYFAFRHVGISAELGIVGAVGDMQDKNGFSGLNRILLNEAVEKGQVLRTKDLRPFGKVTRPLVSFITYCTEPVLPDLTGNDKACAVFLKNEGIETYRNDGQGNPKALCYYDLTVFERKKLASALIRHAYEKGVEERLIKDMVGDVYLFPQEPEGSELREAYEFSTLLNACGRHGHAETGIGACLHDNASIERARELLAEHRKAIRAGINLAKERTVDAGPFYLLDGRGVISDTVIGVVAGAYFSSGLVERTKPILALSLDENTQIKASGRANKDLCEKGLDLGEVMKKSAETVGGFGGGHVVAAGASFPNTPENLKTFLRMAKEIVEVQLQLK
ncbi:DHH family phosphoesterase [Candidatus Micrarchaeota archaeon]|nr:DHH family phosphoesterase [Candidatus Micrarchaeota archaeon]